MSEISQRDKTSERDKIIDRIDQQIHTHTTLRREQPKEPQKGTTNVPIHFKELSNTILVYILQDEKEF